MALIPSSTPGEFRTLHLIGNKPCIIKVNGRWQAYGRWSRLSGWPWSTDETMWDLACKHCILLNDLEAGTHDHDILIFKRLDIEV